MFDVDTRNPSLAEGRMVFSPRVAAIEPMLRQLFDYRRRHDLPLVFTTCLGVLRELRKAQVAAAGEHSPCQAPASCPYAVPFADCLDPDTRYVSVDGSFPPPQPHSADRDIFLERRGCCTPEENVASFAYDVFINNPHAADVIRGLEVRRWAVFGLALEYCIKAATHGLLNLGCDVVLLADAVLPSAHSSPQTVAATYRELQQHGARLCTVREFLEGKAWDG